MSGMHFSTLKIQSEGRGLYPIANELNKIIGEYGSNTGFYTLFVSIPVHL